jgi:hypothetical protein
MAVKGQSGQAPNFAKDPNILKTQKEKLKPDKKKSWQARRNEVRLTTT